MELPRVLSLIPPPQLQRKLCYDLVNLIDPIYYRDDPEIVFYETEQRLG